MRTKDQRIIRLISNLRNDTCKIGFFGSAFDEKKKGNHDIDICLFVKNSNYELLRNKIENMSHLRPLIIEKYLMNYAPLDDIGHRKNDKKPIHISFLPYYYSEYKDSYFWNRIKDKIEIMSIN